MNRCIATLCAAAASTAAAQTINEDQRLVADDASAFLNMGNAVSISADILVAGARSDDVNGSSSGSAYIFQIGTGVQLQKLIPDDGEPLDRFGAAVSISGGIVVAGAVGDDDNGSRAGAAYVFNGLSGAQIHKLTANDGTFDDEFGSSVAIDGSAIVVGAPGDDIPLGGAGSIYVFDSGSGLQLRKITAPDAAPGDNLGASIAIHEGIIAAGAIGDDDNGSNSGSAYTFNASTGAQIAKLVPDDGTSGDLFGASIAIHNGIVVVGVPNDDDNGSFAGAAYTFDANTGKQLARLAPPSPMAFDNFASGVAIHNGTVCIGAFGIGGSGTAYLFDANSGQLTATLIGLDSAPGDAFGAAVAMDGQNIAVGAPSDDSPLFDAGSVYTFTPPDDDCPADLNDDGALDFFDVAIFLGLFSDGDLTADFIADGTLDFFDVVEFLSQFAEGCP